MMSFYIGSEYMILGFGLQQVDQSTFDINIFLEILLTSILKELLSTDFTYIGE